MDTHYCLMIAIKLPLLSRIFATNGSLNYDLHAFYLLLTYVNYDLLTAGLKFIATDQMNCV